MSAKKLNYAFLSGIAILGLLYFNAASKFRASTQAGDIDARYFPRILAVALIVLCIISLIQSIKSKDKILNFENKPLILKTIGVTIVYFVLWSIVGFFYPLTFLFLMSLFMIYKEKPVFDKGLMIPAIVSLSLTVFIYIVFDWVMSVQF